MRLRPSCLALSATAVALSAPLARAQDNGALVLAPIVVTGELQRRTLFDTPTSVAIATGEDLERRGERDVYGLIERTPNVTASNGRQGFAIRGIDQRGVGGGGAGQTISVQVDGVALPGNQSTFFGPYSTWDLEQVEVLRGPQSTQQGRNALAGAIVIRSKDPTFEQEFKARGELGSRATRRASVAANVPLIDETLALRVSGDAFRTDGWVENPTLGIDDYDAQEMRTLRAKLRFDPTEDVSAVLSYSRSDNSGGEDSISAAEFPGQRLNFSNRRAEEGSTIDIFGLRATWDVTDRLTLEAETSYLQDDYVRSEDFDGGPQDLGFTSRDGDLSAFEQDLRLRFDFEALSGVVGAFYTSTDSEIPPIATFDASVVGPIPPGLVTVERRNTFGAEVENFALFGEVDVPLDALAPGLTLTAGARYDVEEVTVISRENVRTTPPVAFLPPEFQALIPPDSDFRTTEDFTAFLPKLGLTYDWTEDLATSFTVQRGYRSGGAALNNFTGVVSVFDPEYTWNYELAVRAALMGGRVRVAANAFYTDWEDQQVEVSGPSGNILDVDTVNAGTSRLFGGELSMDADVSDGLTVFGSLGYIETEFTDFRSGGVDFTGNEFPNAPRFTGAAGAAYDFRNGFRLAADVSYTAEEFSTTANRPGETTDSRFLVNAQLSYGEGPVTGTLYVRNLLDEDYATSRFDSGVVRAGEPLTVGAFVDVRF
ncbi:TonB-dependent receptor [Rubrimonas cliftonensis]|uniref:Outer membrane receptor proteins, mostly Fe transport n=1 Tax=Rubrimonas cliftonensis TaxID=89524 RepID=A0A1H4EZT2_9RHOB|nr:TonB-dependent receptor [Rubrimonas cliftonensis]SEA90534.1 Outer membrane receptor proteins, mostly Fe transport [Rubrimonas cliftonensis]